MNLFRDIHPKLLTSAIVFRIVELLWSRKLFAARIKPDIDKWFLHLDEMARDLRNGRFTDIEFQTKIEELFDRVDLESLCRLAEIDRLRNAAELPDNGVKNIWFDLEKVGGLPSTLSFGRQIVACKRGRSVVPHGHVNMCSGFIVLAGSWRGRHYDRMETIGNHYIIRPTIDRIFSAGDCSTISDHKDNVHWFEALSDNAFMLNVHVFDYDHTITETSDRLYLDPAGEKIAGGCIRAAKLTHVECHQKYG